MIGRHAHRRRSAAARRLRVVDLARDPHAGASASRAPGAGPSRERPRDLSFADVERLVAAVHLDVV
jgi:hypothetical protein